MSDKIRNMLILEKPDVKARGMKYVTHIIVLAIAFVLPEVLLSWGHSVPKIVYLHTMFYVAVFYLNYAILIDKLLFKGKLVAFIGVNAFILVAFFFLMMMCFQDFVPMPHGENMPHGREFMKPHGGLLGKKGGFIIRDELMLVLAMCLSVAVKLSEKWVRWTMLEKQMIMEKNESELKNLKNQLNPHFLFNTLNNIYALIGISQQKAQHAVHELSQLLRYMLYETNSMEVPLERDLLFLKNYIELMRLRLTNSVTLMVKINESDGNGLKIAPLLFISLVENAFKHGVSGSEPTVISIAISVEGSSVHCHVENTCVVKDETDRSGSGVGISNLRRQLAILYAGRHSYTTELRNGLYIADLVIELGASDNQNAKQQQKINI